MRVACCQLPITLEAATNRRLVAEALAECGPGSDLVVLPELASSGYVLADVDEARARAETVDGPFVSGLRELSRTHGCVVVAGFAEDAGATLHNSAVVVDHGQVLAVHRKTHLWDQEPRLFTPGDVADTVVDTSAGRIAVLVCYELEFPELVRRAAQRGAQVVAAPVNWPVVGEPAGERTITVVKAQAQASAYGVFVAAADRCGPERGVEWVGSSVICSPQGFPLAGPAGTDPCIITADIDPARADDKQISAGNHVLGDRRPELYGEAISPR